MLQTSSWFGLPVPLISALFGGLLALLGSALFNWNQRRIERKRLRRVLAAEMSELGLSLFVTRSEEFSDWGVAQVDRFHIGNLLPHPQYDANQSNLKFLSTFEVSHIVRFYDRVDRARLALTQDEGVNQTLVDRYGSEASSAHATVEPYLTGNILFRWKHRQKRRWNQWATKYRLWRNNRTEE